GYTNAPQDAFAAADIVLLPSISEGFPNSTLEAMLCGRPVVVTSVGGLPEQVGTTGLVVEPRNPRQLADAVVSLSDDEALRRRLGDEARARAASQFTVERLRTEHLTSYLRLLRGLGPRAALGSPDLSAAVDDDRDPSGGDAPS